MEQEKNSIFFIERWGQYKCHSNRMEFMYGKYIGGQLHWLEAPSHVTVLVSNYVNVILKHIEIIWVI